MCLLKAYESEESEPDASNQPPLLLAILLQHRIPNSPFSLPLSALNIAAVSAIAADIHREPAITQAPHLSNSARNFVVVVYRRLQAVVIEARDVMGVSREQEVKRPKTLIIKVKR
jgi:hypothetical protein